VNRQEAVEEVDEEFDEAVGPDSQTLATEEAETAADTKKDENETKNESPEKKLEDEESGEPETGKEMEGEMKVTATLASPVAVECSNAHTPEPTSKVDQTDSQGNCRTFTCTPILLCPQSQSHASMMNV
jgi:hypothetical protein